MSDKSLSRGGFYYLVYNVLNVAFPFLTGIYVARVLLPESIGTVAAAQNVARYFVILAFLGIPTYGLREISKTRNDPEERSRVYSELFLINLCSTVVFLAVYLIVIFSVPIYRAELALYLVVGLAIALNAFNIGWLYEGLEEFRFISLRGLIFKALSFVFLVVFVRSQRDVLLYALVTVVGTAGNYVVNMACAPRFVRFTRKGLNLRRHMRSIMALVAVNLAIELYSLVDVTMMNFLCDKDSIAFYKYGSAINSILLQIVNTFTMVLVPRISYYYKENKLDEFSQLLSKAVVLIVFTAAPMIVGVFFTADFLIVQLYGEAFLTTAGVLKLLSLLLLISPIGYLLGSRVLLATGHEERMIIPVSIGALVNIIGNALLIPRFAEFGATAASVLSETAVMLIYVGMGKRYFRLRGVFGSVWRIALSCAAMAAYLFGIARIQANGWLVVSLQIVGAVLLYGALLLALREGVAVEYTDKIVEKCKRIMRRT